MTTFLWSAASYMLTAAITAILTIFCTELFGPKVGMTIGRWKRKVARMFNDSHAQASFRFRFDVDQALPEEDAQRRVEAMLTDAGLRDHYPTGDGITGKTTQAQTQIEYSILPMLEEPDDAEDSPLVLVSAL